MQYNLTEQEYYDLKDLKFPLMSMESMQKGRQYLSPAGEPIMQFDILQLKVSDLTDEKCHLYLWVPNALLQEGLQVMKEWGFTYKTNIIWQKIRKDGEPDGRGVGFYFRNTTEILLFGIKGKDNRTLNPGRTQVNVVKTIKREHSRKPDEMYSLIESCSTGPFLELFARNQRDGWDVYGNEVNNSIVL